MAIKANFSPTPGLLSVFDDNADDTITISRNAAGQILINGGAVSVDGGQPTVANTALMQHRLTKRGPSIGGRRKHLGR